MAPADVRRAEPADAPGAVRALAAAFLDDPVWRFFLPGENLRAKRMPLFFDTEVGHLGPGHELWVAESGAAVAIWAAPGRWRASIAHTLATAPAMARVFGRRLSVAARAQMRIERRHPTGVPHWYLHYLGAAPADQGKGLGSALLAPVLERCDRDGLPAFLETSTPRARALYSRHGFEVTGRFHLPAGGPLIWQMWREPAPY